MVSNIHIIDQNIFKYFQNISKNFCRWATVPGLLSEFENIFHLHKMFKVLLWKRKYSDFLI